MDSWKMFSVVNNLLGKDLTSPVLPELSDQCAANTLSAFFEEKIEAIRAGLVAEGVFYAFIFVGGTLSEFSPLTDDQLAKIISNCKPTSCSVDLIATRIVLDCKDILLPVLVNNINSSLQSSIVPKPLKTAAIKPLLKKNGLNLCKHYCPVSNLYVSKLLECVVAKQLVSHLGRHDLLDKFQAAYQPGYSCETALLCVLNMSCAMQMVVTCYFLYSWTSVLHQPGHSPDATA